MASTGTGSLGIKDVFQLKGAVDIPQNKMMARKINATNLLLRKYLMSLFIIFFAIIITLLL
jgi:hypothetical protein